MARVDPCSVGLRRKRHQPLAPRRGEFRPSAARRARGSRGSARAGRQRHGLPQHRALAGIFAGHRENQRHPRFVEQDRIGLVDQGRNADPQQRRRAVAREPVDPPCSAEAGRARWPRRAGSRRRSRAPWRAPRRSRMRCAAPPRCRPRTPCRDAAQPAVERRQGLGIAARQVSRWPSSHAPARQPWPATAAASPALRVLPSPVAISASWPSSIVSAGQPLIVEGAKLGVPAGRQRRLRRRFAALPSRVHRASAAHAGSRRRLPGVGIERLPGLRKLANRRHHGGRCVPHCRRQPNIRPRRGGDSAARSA